MGQTPRNRKILIFCRTATLLLGIFTVISGILLSYRHTVYLGLAILIISALQFAAKPR